MNASAPVVTREVEVQSKIAKVRAFSRIARVVCSVVFGFGLVGSVVTLLIGVLGAFGLGSPGAHGGAGLTPHHRAAPLSMTPLVFGVWLAVVYQLYRLFGNLAAGSIYTPENVRRMRNVGLLWLVSGVLGILIPVTWALLIRLGAIEPSLPPESEVLFSWVGSSNSFITAGFILLVSWIMDVGLYQKDHADALQRDADLVI